MRSRQVGEHNGEAVYEHSLCGPEVEGVPTLQLTVCDYGATITSVKSRSRDGVAEELTLGQNFEVGLHGFTAIFDSSAVGARTHSYSYCQDLVAKPGYFGVTVGRYANR